MRGLWFFANLDIVIVESIAKVGVAPDDATNEG